MMAAISIVAFTLSLMMFADSFRCPAYMRWIRRFTALCLLAFVIVYLPNAAAGRISEETADPVRVALLAVLLSKGGEIISRWGWKR